VIFTKKITQHLALGVVIISASIMGFIIYELSNTKEYFAHQLIEQSSERLESDLDEFFMPIRNLMTTLKQQQENLFLEEFNAVSLNNYFIPIIEEYSQISSIGLADSRGFEFNIIPDSTANGWLNREVHVDEWGMVEEWDSWVLKDDSLTHLRSWQQELANDPRERPWFVGALFGDEINWTVPYTYMTGDVGITASTKWQLNSPDTLQHILAFDVTLEDLSDFSQQIQLTENNKNYILTSPDQNIIGLPQGYSNLSNMELSDKLMTSPENFGHQPLQALLEYPIGQIVTFDGNNEKWWGIIEPYSINSTQELFLVVLIPESDFSSEIDSTRTAVIGGFMIILLLSLMLVRNQNRLKKISEKLNETNQIIEEQNEHLFSEVHHRVKNNLAMTSALISIEHMKSEDPSVNEMCRKTLNRIKSMSAVHEIVYSSDHSNRVQVKDFLEEIIKLNFDNERDFNTTVDGAFINVNQALTYSLVLNELIGSIATPDRNGKASFDITVDKVDDNLVTEIKVSTDSKSLEHEQTTEEDILNVLLTQLDATLEKKNYKKSIEYILTFTLEDRKGITSNHVF
jgi:two-component sensor histidine kinase